MDLTGLGLVIEDVTSPAWFVTTVPPRLHQSPRDSASAALPPLLSTLTMVSVTIDESVVTAAFSPVTGFLGPGLTM